jgi:hypothetical protein
MAPFLETFYYEWGSGQGSAEFISLSVRANDSNADVERYKARVNGTFPGAGNDGGGLAATQPYTNGTYGVFLGSPTFVVIAPDRTVTYNPKGSSFAATIDSLERALRSTGVAKPAVFFTLTGKVQNPDSIGIRKVHLKVRNADPDSTYSDSTGAFEWTTKLVARDRYRLQLERNDDHANGLSSFDIIRIQRHLLGVEPFTNPYELLAADVDRSGAVSLIDILQIRRLLLRIDTELSKNKSWLLLNGDYQFNDPTNPFFEAYTGEAASFGFRSVDKTVAPFSIIAIKIGDVNFSAR